MGSGNFGLAVTGPVPMPLVRAQLHIMCLALGWFTEVILCQILQATKVQLIQKSSHCLYKVLVLWRLCLFVNILTPSQAYDFISFYYSWWMAKHTQCDSYSQLLVIAECLSMRHIILRGRRVPTVEYALCIYIYS